MGKEEKMRKEKMEEGENLLFIKNTLSELL